MIFHLRLGKMSFPFRDISLLTVIVLCIIWQPVSETVYDFYGALFFRALFTALLSVARYFLKASFSSRSENKKTKIQFFVPGLTVLYFHPVVSRNITIRLIYILQQV